MLGAMPFLSEWVLFWGSLFLLFLPRLLLSATHRQGGSLLATQKKSFFVGMRGLQCLLVVVFCYDLVGLLSGAVAVDQLGHVGNYFFRVGFYCLMLNCFLTGLAVLYCYLVMFLFSRALLGASYFVLELPFLVLCTVLGLRLIIATTDFFLLIILLEVVAFCSVIFIGLQLGSGSRCRIPLEATLKYFIINGIAVIVLLLGVGGYFYLTSQTNLHDILSVFQHNYHLVVFFFEQVWFSYLVFLFAFMFKLGGAPAHNWVPDVYEGADTLVTGFLVLVVSPPVFIKMMQVLKGLGLPLKNGLGLVGFMDSYMVEPALGLVVQIPGALAWGLGVLSVFVGTLGAYYQTRIKRFIAYASITHFGFMFLAVVTFTVSGYLAAFFYLAIYVLTNFCFFLLLLLNQYYFSAGWGRLIFINQLKPHVQSSLFFLGGFLICVLSFAGIPPLAGFFAKFFILSVLLLNGLEGTALFLLGAILTGTFVYLRFIKIVVFESAALGLSSKTWVGPSFGGGFSGYSVTGSRVYPFYMRYAGIWQEQLVVVAVFGFGLLLFLGGSLAFGLTGILELTLSFVSF